MPPRDGYNELLLESFGLPNGPAKVAVLEEAVRAADAAGDLDDGYRCREYLLDAAVSSGRGDLLLAHYAWCLAQHDAHPDRFNTHSLLWRYKWVSGNAVSFPEISLAQLHALIDDMDRRFKEYGAGARAVLAQRYGLARHVGDKEAAADLFVRHQRTPRDHLSDCAACEADDAVDHHIFFGRNRRAVAAATAIVSGRLSCTTVPESTFAVLLKPLVRLGELDEAARLHRAGLRLALQSGDGVTNFGRHLEFLGLTDNLTAGLRLLARTLPAGLGGYEPISRHRYLTGSLFLLERVAVAGLNPKVRVPVGHVLSPDGKGVPADALQAWVATEAAGLAARFDARNGTDAFARGLAKRERLHRQVKPFPLDK